MLFGEEHTQKYKETGGQEGHDWQGTQTLLLTTKGRKSGEPRELPLIYGKSGDDYLIVASKGGAGRAARLVPEHRGRPGRRAAGRGTTASRRRPAWPRRRRRPRCGRR